MKEKVEQETIGRPWPVLAFAVLVLATGLLQLIFVPRPVSQSGGGREQPRPALTESSRSR